MNIYIIYRLSRIIYRMICVSGRVGWGFPVESVAGRSLGAAATRESGPPERADLLMTKSWAADLWGGWEKLWTMFIKFDKYSTYFYSWNLVLYYTAINHYSCNFLARGFVLPDFFQVAGGAHRTRFPTSAALRNKACVQRWVSKCHWGDQRFFPTEPEDVVQIKLGTPLKQQYLNEVIHFQQL